MAIAANQPRSGTFIKELKLNVEWNWREKWPLTVFVQGYGEEDAAADGEGNFEEKMVILTVHDVGTNPLRSFIPLVNSKQMAKLREHALFLHVCIPGQESGAQDLVGDFPTMEQLAEVMPQVLDQIGAAKCIAIGEGAGADIVCRFAFLFPEMLEGIILVQFTSAPHGFFENLREIFSNVHIRDSEMNEDGWEYLLAHKFGEHCEKERKAHFMEQIGQMALNERNIGKYLYSFSCRDDFTDMLKKLKVYAILVTGSKSPHNKNVFQMFKQMNKEKSAMLVAENALDILKEAREFVAQAIHHVCQRHSYLANIVVKIQDESAFASDEEVYGRDGEDDEAEEEKEEAKAVDLAELVLQAREAKNDGIVEKR